MTGGRVTRLAVVAALVVLALDLLVQRRLTFVFDIGFVQAVVSGLAHRATGLLAAYLLALGVLAIRQRVIAKRRRATYSKREVSPAPTRATTGSPSEKSTTVVGSEPHSPESITASNQ